MNDRLQLNDAARRVMQCAHQEVQRFRHDYLGDEHILLGMIRAGNANLGMTVLKKFADPQTIRLELEKRMTSGDTIHIGTLQSNIRAERVRGAAKVEAKTFSHNYVGTEHLLLGLLCQRDGIVAEVLANFGLKLPTVRAEVLSLLAPKADEQAPICVQVDKTVHYRFQSSDEIDAQELFRYILEHMAGKAVLYIDVVTKE